MYNLHQSNQAGNKYGGDKGQVTRGLALRYMARRSLQSVAMSQFVICEICEVDSQTRKTTGH